MGLWVGSELGRGRSAVATEGVLTTLPLGGGQRAGFPGRDGGYPAVMDGVAPGGWGSRPWEGPGHGACLERCPPQGGETCCPGLLLVPVRAGSRAAGLS